MASIRIGEFKNKMIITNSAITSSKIFKIKEMRITLMLIGLCLGAMSMVHAQKLDLIPKPVHLEQHGGTFIIPSSVRVVLDTQLEPSASYIDSEMLRVAAIAPNITLGAAHERGAIVLLVDDELDLPKDGYQLNVNKNGVDITSPTANGLLNGFQTLLQIMSATDVKKGTIPHLTIEDYPRFNWRGMMLDVSRQFFDKATVLNYIDWLAVHKMNVFHWHLTDDNGWRIEIKSLPELTSKGAWRGPGEVLPPAYGSGNERYGGYYTQEDIKEVVAYASARGISIMPEIEIPGHSRAAIAAYPEIGCINHQQTKSVQGEINNVWCVGREENYQLLDGLIKEFTHLFPFEYIHVAGDEVNRATWEQCPNCQALMEKEGFDDTFQLQNYFFRRVEKIVEKYNRKAVGWNEILKGGTLSPKTQIFAWQGVDYGIESAKQGYNTIMIPGQFTYFDMAQSSLERGHRWAAIIDTERVYGFEPIPAHHLSMEEQELIKGVQGALWSEYLDRPARFMEYQSYPRISALSEVAWSPKESKNWEDFYLRLTNSHLQRLADMGIAFREFPPTAIYKKGSITVTPPYLGAKVHFEADGNEPTTASPIYTSPIETTEFEGYRFRTFFNEVSASPIIKAETPPVAQWETSKVETLKFSEDISEYIDKEGIYYLTFHPTDERTAHGEVKGISLFENDQLLETYPNAHPLRVIAPQRFLIKNYNDKNTYRLEFNLENGDEKHSSAIAKLHYSPYLEPEVKVSASITENPKFPLSNLEDYNPNTYLRTNVPCEAGDWILYTFKNPVTASKIEVLTGIPNHPRFFINDGHVEYSYNGVDFEKGEAFNYGLATILPKQPIKAVKIKITGTNHEPIVAGQDLRIIP